MKRIKGKILLFMVLLLLPIIEIYVAGISVSPTSLTISPGSSKSFTIKASSAAGRVDISSSDTSVATVSSSSKFLDNSSVKITVKGKKEGTAKITIKLTDVATYEGKTLSGSKTVNITVKKPAEKVYVPKVMNITKFQVVGYDLDFKKDVLEYSINVDKNVKSLYILIEGSNYTATGNKVVNIENKDSIKVTLKDDKETKEYTIKINRTSSEASKENIKEPETKIITIEKEVKDKTYFYTTIGLGILCFILLILYITKKPKEKTVDNTLEFKKENNNINNTIINNQTVTYQPNNNFDINPTQYNSPIENENGGSNE